MAGYAGYSMSNNAIAAYDDYKMPLSRAKDALGLKDIGDVSPCEWHHTSSRYNQTNFYDLREMISRRFLAENSRPRPNQAQIEMRAEVRSVFANEKRWEHKEKIADKKEEIRKNKIRNWLLKTKYAKLIMLGERACRRYRGKGQKYTNAGGLMSSLYLNLDKLFKGSFTSIDADYMMNHLLRRSPRTLVRCAEVVCFISRNFKE